MTTNQTRGQKVAEEVSSLFRARTPLIWIVTREEARAESLLVRAALAAGYTPRTWDVGQGVAGLNGEVDRQLGGVDPDETLNVIRDRATTATRFDRGVWIMRDLPAWIVGPQNAKTLRLVRNLARFLPAAPRERAQGLVVISPSAEVPPELVGHTAVIEWPLPDAAEIAALLDAAIESLPEFESDKDGKPDPTKPLRSVACPNGTRDKAINAAVGLSQDEAQSCFSRSLVTLRKIDPQMVANEKKRIIAREKVLEWYDPLPGGLDSVGGLENLKSWLKARALAYSPKARKYGLPAPKGVLLVGVPGCGKTMTAKALSTAYQVPLLRVDLGALKDKYVGQSEANLRKVFKVIEAIGRCVVWFDEIEKSLAGATQGAADGGVSSDALGAVLSWMQERQGEAFVVATANDVSALPPELLRKGRFDEVWFVDLPSDDERRAIIKSALKSAGRGDLRINFDAVADATESFTGSEIAAIVPEAMFAAFADGEREITTKDLQAAALDVVPLSSTMAEKIAKLREWADGRARKASKSSEVVPVSTRTSRVLDL